MSNKIEAKTYIENAETVHIHQADNQLLQAIQESITKQVFVANEQRAEEIAEERVLDGKIKQVSDLINSRKFSIAKDLLNALRDNEDNYDETRKAKIANNIGVCALHLGDISLAIAEFSKALGFEPNNAKFLGNAAMAAFIDNDIDSAIELSQRSRIILPEYSQATTVFIQALNAKGKTSDIEQLLNDEHWILDDSSCLLALGTVSYLNGNYRQSEEYLRNALDKENTDPQILNLLSISIFHPIVQQLQDDPPLPWKTPEELIQRAKEAMDLAEKEVELRRDTENRGQFHSCLCNLAQVVSFLGEKERAVGFCDLVLGEDNSHDAALNTKGITLFHLTRYKDAIECLTKVVDPSTVEVQTMTLALAFVNERQVNKAIDLLEKQWDPDSNERRMIQIAEALSFSYGKLPPNSENKLDEVITFLNQDKFRKDPEVALVKSDIFYLKGETERATQILLQAIDFATDNQRDRIHFALANQAFYQSHWKDAAHYFSLIVNVDTPENIKQQYAIALINAERFQDALLFCQGERNNGEPISVITEIEARILEYEGDLPSALALRLKIHETKDEINETNLIKAFNLALRLGRDEEAKKIILEADLTKIQDSPWALSQIAQAYTILGIDGAIQLAYKARKLGFQSPEYHLAYLRVFLSREDAEAQIFRPTEIQNNSVVEVLLSTNEKRVFQFTNEESEDIEKNIISLTNPLALKFMGKKIGETIVLRENSLQTLTAQITEIKSKYVYAFQETLLKFATWFPDNAGIHSIDTKDNNFNVIFSQLDKRFAHVRFVMELHQEKRLPLSVLAKLIDRSRVVTWSGMTSRSEDKIFASIGNVNDIDGIIENNKIVLDLVGILSANYLGILEKLPEAFDEIFVSQAVLDELNEELVNEKVDSKKTRATVARFQDGYQHHEYSEDEVNSYLEFLTKLRDFITDKTNVVGTSLALSIEKEKLDELSKILGEGAIASILVAKEKDALLYADDLSINQIAQNDWNVSSVWSQVIIANLKNKGIICTDEYHEGVYKLIIANYQFPAFNLENFLWGIRKNEWKVTYELERFLIVLELKGLEDDWVVEQCAEIIKQSVLEISQLEYRSFFLDFILKTLTKGRNRIVILEKLKQRLIAKFYLLQFQLAGVLETIDLWASQKG